MVPQGHFLRAKNEANEDVFLQRHQYVDIKKSGQSPLSKPSCNRKQQEV
jgi:hypothetical protein